MTISVLKSIYAICRLPPESATPKWATQGDFFSISKTSAELSIVCEQSFIPDDVKSVRDWKMLKVEGVLDFGLTGILASIANPLAQAQISIFSISTFDTDYFLLKTEDLVAAVNVLKSSGFKINSPIPEQ